MKKKFLALLLSVAMVVSTMPAAAVEDTMVEQEKAQTETMQLEEEQLEEEQTEESETEEALEEEKPEASKIEVKPIKVQESVPEGTPISGEIGDYSIAESGTYYLSSDATGNITVAEGVSAVLDLNGFVLKGGASGSVITNNGTLTVKDSDKTKTHYYTVGSDGLWAINTEATEGTPYENLTERPAEGTVIAIKGGAVTGGAMGTLIDGSNYGCDGTIAVGGGIYSAGNLTIDGAVICGNTINNTSGGEYKGIGIFCAGENCTLEKGATICGNACMTNECYPGGGAIFSTSAISAENSFLSFNTVSYNGGAIFVGGTAKVSLTNCAISENSADLRGGGIYLTSRSVVEITGGKIADNTAGEEGGGLYVDANIGTSVIGQAILTGVEVSGNKAANGGGVGMNYSAQLLMNGCTVTGNSAVGTDDYTGMGGGIYKPSEKQQEKEDWPEKVVLLNTKITGNTAVQNGGGIYFKKTEYEYDTCFVKGTLITMADGTKKKVEDVEVGDMVKTFDHEKGEFSSAKVYIAWHEKMDPQVTYKLHFEDGYAVHCVAAHTFLEKTSKKYLRFTASTAESHVGQYFFAEDGKWHKLESVSIEENTENLYEIYTSKHQNAFAEGMLSAPDDIVHILNIYELDENLKADEKQLAKDIEEYGLASYEYANEKSGGMTREWYEDAGVKYAFIVIGKGGYTEKDLVDTYKEATKEEADAEGIKAAFKNVTALFMPIVAYAAEEPVLDDFDGGYLTIGTGTEVTGNTVGTDKNNVYLETSRKKSQSDSDFVKLESLIKVVPGASDMNIGVTTSDTPTDEAAVPVTTAENSTDFSEYFTSDNPDYAAYNRGLDSEQQIAIGIEKAVIVETGIAYGTVQAAIDAASNGQTVKMVADSTENVEVGSASDRSKVVTIDLNGKTLKSTGTVEGIRHNAICNFATLTIADSSKDGSGTITGGTGAVMGKGSYGGGVYNSGGTLTMTGGTITGNSAGFGGGAANVEGSFTMTGGTISGNTSTGTGGGGVANIGGGTFIMTGGSITGNSATGNGGGVYNDGTMKVSGTAKVTDNTKGTGANNVYLPDGKTITVETAGLSKGASIGITTQNAPETSTVPVTGANTKDYSSYFTSDGGFSVKNEVTGNDQVVVLSPHTHSFTYGLAKTNEDNDTIEASCGTEGCSLEDMTLTIKAPTGLTYDGESHNAVFAQTSFCGSTTLPEITYQYKAEKSGTYANTDSTKPAGYYKASFTVGSKTASIEYKVDKKQLTLTGTQLSDKSYDGSANISCNVGTVNGIVAGDAVTVGVASSSAADKSVGKDKAVTIKFNVSGKDASNYTAPVDNTSLTATVSQAQLSISGTTVSGKTYDGTVTAQATVGTVSGAVTDEDVQVEIDKAEFENKNVGTSKQVTVTYKLTGDDAGNYTKPEDNSGLTANITAKQLTVSGTTVSEKTYDGTTAAQAAIGTVSGVIEGDTVTTSIDSAEFENKNVGTGKAVTVKYEISGDDAGNYLAPADDSSLTANITAKQLTVSGTAVSGKTYDGTVAAQATKGTVSGVIQGEDVTTSIESADFENKNVGTGKAVTVKYEISGDDAGNYLAPADDSSLTANITAKQLTVSGTAVSGKTYDGTVAAQATKGTVSGVIQGDTVTTSIDSAEFENKNVGTGKAVTVKYEISGDDAGNYLAPADDSSLTANITAKQLTVSGTTVSEKTYDGTTAAQAAMGTVSGVVQGESVTTSVKSAEFENKNVGTGKAVTVKYEITGDDAGNYLAPADDSSLTANITAKQLTVSGTTVSGKTYDGTVAAQAAKGTVSGVVQGDTVITSIDSAEFADKNAGTDKTVTVKYEISGDDAGNYLAPADDSSLKADITAKQLRISGTTVSKKAYDGTTAATATKGTVSGIIEGDDVAVEIDSAAFAEKNVGKAKTVAITYKLTGDAKNNYSAPAEEENTAEITAKEINVAAVGKTSYVGSDLEALTYTADELCTGDSFTGALSTDADKNTVKAYDIVQGTLTVNDGNDGKNYDISFTGAKYTVTDKEVQTLSFEGVTDGNVTKNYGDSKFTEAVTGAETTVTYSSSNPEVATVDSATGEVTILKAGSTVITATAAETYKYAEGEAQYTLTVDKVKVDVPEAVTSLIYNGKEQTGVVLPEGAKYTLTDNAETNAGEYTAAAELTDKDNYEWKLETATTDDQEISWSIAKKSISAAAEDKSSYVGSDLEALTYTADDLCTGDSFTGTLSTDADKNTVGKYDITQGTLAVNDGNDGKNYDISFTGAKYTVKDKEVQTLSFKGVTGGKVTKKYGDKSFTEVAAGADTTVRYSSSNPEVASVDPVTGKVTILKDGTAVITATAAETYKYAEGEASYRLTVKKVVKDGLMATGTAKASANTIRWNRVSGADGYEVCFAECGDTVKKIKSTTALEYTKKGLSSKKEYKYQIKAYKVVKGKRQYIATSPIVHVAGVKSKYSNAAKVTVKKTSLSLSKGRTAKLGAKIAKKSSSKTVLWKDHVGSKIRYKSMDKSVVTVDKNGRVKAVGKGAAYVYAYAANGIYAKVAVTVK